MPSESGQKLTYVACFVIVSIAVSGYFIGLQSPMNPVDNSITRLADSGSKSPLNVEKSRGSAVVATSYAEMQKVIEQANTKNQTSLTELKYRDDPFEEFTITPAQKNFALAVREQNRAFNGAPPTVPHEIDQMSAESCMACHGEGYKSETLRISKMSHEFLFNCTQCHVENNPTHMAASLFRENTFVGLPAPAGGSRAFEGAPPMIPHSTWMRVDCVSCHGFTGQHGLRTTHPWRQNCQQCHASSSKLEQVQLESESEFLPPIKVSR